MKGNIIFKAIKLIYPQIEGGYTYWENQTNLADGLVWENKIFSKPKWEDIEKLIPQIELQDAKEAKIAILSENYKLAIKKDYYISNAILIDNLGQNIGVSDAIFSIKDPNVLTHETAVVFAGAFKIQETFNQILIEEIKKLLPALPDYATIKTKVYNSNKVFIPYTTTNKDKEEIKVKLSAKNIDGIFSHLFDRVAKTSSLMGIKKQAIEDATTIEQLEAIDLTFPK